MRGFKFFHRAGQTAQRGFEQSGFYGGAGGLVRGGFGECRDAVCLVLLRVGEGGNFRAEGRKQIKQLGFGFPGDVSGGGDSFFDFLEAIFDHVSQYTGDCGGLPFKNSGNINPSGTQKSGKEKPATISWVDRDLRARFRGGAMTGAMATALPSRSEVHLSSVPGFLSS